MKKIPSIMIVVWGIAVLCTLFLSSCKRPEVLDNSTLVNSARNYNPQNEMFSHLGTKRYNFKNETQLFKVIPHTSKFQKNRPASPERNTFEGS